MFALPGNRKLRKVRKIAAQEVNKTERFGGKKEESTLRFIVTKELANELGSSFGSAES